MLHLPKHPVVLKVFPENKLFHISKRALQVGTACNKGLKEALACAGIQTTFNLIHSNKNAKSPVSRFKN